MLFKPPLSFDELKAIQDRSADNADVRKLLWEIRRLQAIVLRADQLAGSVPEAGGAVGMIVAALREQVKDDPSVLRRAGETRKLLDPASDLQDE